LQLLYIAYSIFGILAVSHGLGKHTLHVPQVQWPKAIMFEWLASAMYVVTSLLSKWIVGLFLLRICPHRRWRQITIWAMLGIVSIFSVLYFFFLIFACQPIQHVWTQYSPDPSEGTCKTSNFATAVSYIASSLNIVADWVLPALPATLVWKAPMIELRIRISIIALLCLGST
jgi:hypothetical protein